jgi:methionyl-tRNA formyltransferase
MNMISEIRNLHRLKIIFLGTPEFAVASLKAILEKEFEIIAVITAPDKPGGRGLQMSQSAVKKYALEKNLPILQPEKLKNPEFLSELGRLGADLQVVVAFRMLPEAVWNMPPMGTINLHASLLPDYRGAAPINWAIINGENQTGLTTFKLQHEIDTGHILMQEKLSIGPEETAGELHDRMKEIGAGLLVRTIEGLATGNIIEMPQTESKVQEKSAPRIYKETCKINWDRTISEVHNLVRGLSPYPGAFTEIEGKIWKVYRCLAKDEQVKAKPGIFETDFKNFFRVACTNGYIYLTEIQLEGKKKMVIEDFLRGYRPSQQ